ncbi:MAG: DMT family transporter, partial [Pseudomonadota bacterium]
IPSVFISLVTVSVITVSGLFLMPFQNWQPIGIKEIGSLALASLFLMSGFLSIISAMRAGEVAVVTPFRYSVLIFAVILGYILFDEFPGMLTIIGSVIVVASGLYTLYRETKLSRRSRRKLS